MDTRIIRVALVHAFYTAYGVIDISTTITVEK